MYACVHVLIYAGIHRGQKRMLDPLELESQAMLNWVPRTELGLFIRAACDCSH